MLLRCVGMLTSAWYYLCRVASGMQVGFGAVGGIYASTVMLEKEAPLYRTGLWAVCVSHLSLSL